MSGSLVFSWGKYGGFYFFRGYTKRLCLGWIAFTYIPKDLNEVLNEKIKKLMN